MHASWLPFFAKEVVKPYWPKLQAYVAGRRKAYVAPPHTHTPSHTHARREGGGGSRTAAPTLMGTPAMMKESDRAMAAPNWKQVGVESTGRSVRDGVYTPDVALKVNPNMTPVISYAGADTMSHVSYMATLVPKLSPIKGTGAW